MFENRALNLPYRNVWPINSKRDNYLCFVDFIGQPVTPSTTLRFQSATNANVYTYLGAI